MIANREVLRTAANPILCPNCKTDIAVALVEQVRAGLQAEADEQRRLLTEREAQLQQREQEAARREEEMAKVVREQVMAGLQAATAKALQVERASVSQEREAERETLTQMRKDFEQTKRSELELRRQKQAVDQKEADLDLAIERRAAEKAAEARAGVLKAADERMLLEREEHKTTIAALTRTIDDLKRRVEQGSQQSQGEALETSVEELLRREFVHDVVEPVAKGTRGGDVIQRVRTPDGLECGVILWETKRTKNFGQDWLAKLRDDQRALKADVAALVSLVLPTGVVSIGLMDGVCVTSFTCCLAAAHLLRKSLVDLAGARRAHEGRGEKTELLYAYMTGPQFRQRLEGLAEPFRALRDELAKERDAMERIWAKREKQIERALRSACGLVGDVQGIGLGALPGLPLFTLPAPGDEPAAASE